MERPRTIREIQIRRVMTMITQEVIADAYVDGFYLRRRNDPYTSQPFIATAIEGVGRRLGKKDWQSAKGNSKAKERMMNYQRRVQSFCKSME